MNEEIKKIDGYARVITDTDDIGKIIYVHEWYNFDPKIDSYLKDCGNFTDYINELDKRFVNCEVIIPYSYYCNKASFYDEYNETDDGLSYDDEACIILTNNYKESLKSIEFYDHNYYGSLYKEIYNEV